MPSDAARDPVTGLHTKDWIIDLQAQGRAGGPANAALAALVVQYEPDARATAADLGSASSAALERILARRLTPLLRGGTMVGRGDREEFVVLAPDVPMPDQAGPIADRVVRALSQPLQLGTRRLVPQVWAGIAIGAPGCGVELLLRRASLAARMARTAGPNRWQSWESAGPDGPASRPVPASRRAGEELSQGSAAGRGAIHAGNR